MQNLWIPQSTIFIYFPFRRGFHHHQSPASVSSPSLIHKSHFFPRSSAPNTYLRLTNNKLFWEHHGFNFYFVKWPGFLGQVLKSPTNVATLALTSNGIISNVITYTYLFVSGNFITTISTNSPYCEKCSFKVSSVVL